MAWRTSLWARWCGWTARFALGALLAPVLVGLLAYALGPEYQVVGTAAALLFVLLATGFAFVIGTRFRSSWWGFGPLALFALPGAVLGVADGTGLIDGRGWYVLGGVMLLIIGFVLSLVALAGVWWGTRRHAANTPSHQVGSAGDASPAPMR